MSGLDPMNCQDCGRRMPSSRVPGMDREGWLRLGLDGPTYLFCPECRGRARELREVRGRAMRPQAHRPPAPPDSAPG